MQIINHLHLHFLNLKPSNTNIDNNNTGDNVNVDIGNGSIVTIGNYDGLHLGHQAILNKVHDISIKLSLPSTLVTFEPSPREYFKHSPLPQRLMSLREKVLMLRDLGIDRVLLIHFNQHLVQLSPIAFINEILVNKLNTKYLVVGRDFVFGHKSSGNIHLLQQHSTQLNFKVVTIPIYKVEHHRISSSLVRKALLDNDLQMAQKFLGHRYRIIGRIIEGNKLGHNLGFPTANIYINPKIITLIGVYVVKIRRHAEQYTEQQPVEQRPSLQSQQPLYGIANLGFRPTITSQNTPISNTSIAKPTRLLECHIFDFQENIYGEIIEVELIHKLRDEQKFANFTLLQQQIAQDVIDAKNYFAKFVTAQTGS